MLEHLPLVQGPRPYPVVAAGVSFGGEKDPDQQARSWAEKVSSSVVAIDFSLLTATKSFVESPP